MVLLFFPGEGSFLVGTLLDFYGLLRGKSLYHFDKLFTYRVPLSLREQLKPGVRVSVPFGSGNRKRVGPTV